MTTEIGSRPAGREPIVQQRIEAHENEIKQWIAEGASIALICKRLDTSTATLGKIRARVPAIAEWFRPAADRARAQTEQRMESRARLLTEETIEHVREMRGRGESITAVCDYLHITSPTLRKWRAKNAALAMALRGAATPQTGSGETNLGPVSDPKALDQITEWCRHGVSNDAIAVLLGLTPETWAELATEPGPVQEAVRLGRAQGEAEAAARLYDTMVNGGPQQLQAVKFLLGHRWKPAKAKEEKAAKAPEALPDLSPDEISALLSGGAPEDDEI